MNERSFLCRYMAEHPDWETALQSGYGLKIRRDGVYALFLYSYDSDFADPLVQEARGIIIDTESLEVVCWPFRKFGNYTESYADPIDWGTAQVQEKVDGSIMKLWYSERRGRWIFSTNGVIDAAKAVIESSPLGHTFLEAVQSTENYSDLHTETLDRHKTYLFELVGPEVRVIIPYARPFMYHIGTKDNRTGRESDENIGVARPARFPLTTLTDCVAAAARLNERETEVRHEGFVVVDAAWHRVKIKNPDYLVRHKVFTLTLTRENCLDLILSGGQNIVQLCEIRPRDAKVLKYYDWQLEEMFSRADQIAEMSRAMYEEYSHDRAAVAKSLGGHPLAFIGFEALDAPGLPGRQILRGKPLNKICCMIRAYPQEGFF